MLPPLAAAFVKEDGEVIMDERANTPIPGSS